jgi:hypothetical protein
MPGECFFVWKQETPFTLQGFDSLLPRRIRLQEVERGVETAGDHGLEFTDPEASLLLYREFKAPCVPQQYHNGYNDLVTS